MAVTDEIILEIKDLQKYYPVYEGFFRKEVGQVKAVDGVNLYVRRGETLGLVGESGCGKTTLGKCIVRLQDPTGGEMHYRFPDGGMRDLTKLNKTDSFDVRKKIQIVFQDPYSSLNPSKTIQDSFEEPMKLHGISDKQTRLDRIAKLLQSVNMRPEYMKRYPHEFSGGQRQRICIARSLCIDPDLIVLDEPVSALDVSIQAQVLNLLKDIQEELNLTYIFIAHDLSVVEYMSDRIAVMYLGNIMELANAKKLYYESAHPYTEALLSAIPIPVRNRNKNRIILKGDVPSPANPPEGCRFHTRCPRCEEICRQWRPVLKPLKKDPEHFVACHFADTVEDEAAH